MGISGKNLVVECHVRGGIPPPKIIWHLDGSTVKSGHITENQHEWGVSSILHLRVEKSHHQKTLMCSAEHESLSTVLKSDALLDVHCEYKLDPRAN